MTTTKQQALQRAHELLSKVPLVDGHNDLPLVIRLDKDAQGDVAAYGLDRVRQKGDTDIPRMREGKVAAQFWAAFIFPNEKQPASFALQQIALIRRMNALHADAFLPAFRARDVARAKKEGKIASFITIENGAAIENRIHTLDMFYDLGVRLMTLCHNGTTDWCDSATDMARHGGLTEFGKQVIAEMNRLGMIIDLAHVADTVMHQVLDLSSAPVVWSHSNARALCAHPRNVPDDVLARVKSNGGVVMPTFVPDFISQKSLDWMRPLKTEFGATVEDYQARAKEREKEAGRRPRATLAEYCDHVEYVTDKTSVDHVGIGSDFFGGPTPEGLENVSCFPAIFAELMERGWSDGALTKLAGANFVRVFKAVEKAAHPVSTPLNALAPA